MKSKIPLQRTESGDDYAFPPLGHSALAVVARNRALNNTERTPEITKLEAAVASGQICLEGLSLTTELL